MITIIDYKAGNILSIQNMLKKIGVESCIADQVEQLGRAEKLILPGVGHYDYGMEMLTKSGLVETIKKRVLIDGVPILGICLGAQLMGGISEEGKMKGLELIDMEIVKFKKDLMTDNLKIPHMGWDSVEINQKDSRLFFQMYYEPRFYFVHAYHFMMSNMSDALTTSNYGYPFTSAFERDNIFGVQFHPEKSHKYGMKLLENFANI